MQSLFVHWGGFLSTTFAVFTFFFSMFRAFFSMTISTCFKTSDCPQVEKFPSDPGADPTSGLMDRTVPFAFITAGICEQKRKVYFKAMKTGLD